MEANGMMKILIWGFVIVAVLVVLVFLIERWWGGPHRYSGPSLSSRGAKWQGIFLSAVELERLESEASNADLNPREAWVETVYENYRSVPIKKQPVGKRVCVSFIDLQAKKLRPASINGMNNSNRWSVRSGRFTSFEFIPDPKGTNPVAVDAIPKEGELTFLDPEKSKETTFHYRIKK